MHVHALGDFAYRLVVIVAVANDVLSSARYLAFGTTKHSPQKPPARDIAFILRLCLLRQKTRDQGREDNGRSDDACLHDDLLCLDLLSFLGGDLRGESMTAKAVKP